jgi:glycosyltransferase involved in cell wall biosynthesis
LRILHIIADGAPGGGPTVVQTLCEHLAPCGVDSLILTQAGSHLQSQAKATGVRTLGLDFSRRAAGLKLSSRISQIIRDEKIDIVHAHGARSALPVALMPRAARPGFVYTVHGFHYRRKSVLPRLAAREVERFCIAQADVTVFVAAADQALADRERLLGKGRNVLIHNGVAVPAGLATREADRRYDLAFVGRLHPQKDPLILPRILAAMAPEKPSLLIVGSGELEAALRAEIAALGVAGQITLRAAMARTPALALLAQARICLLPSLWEGLPMSLAEAMLLKVAVVASDIPGNAEIVDPGQTGLLAQAGDAAGFAALIRHLLASPAEREAMAARGAAHAAQAFSPERQARAHLEIFQSLMNAPGS